MPYAFRLFGRSPIFTVVAILTLALGTGANSAIFTLVDAVVLLPIPEAEQVVVVWEEGSAVGFPKNTPAPESVVGRAVEQEFFGVFGVRSAYGRVFTAKEDSEREALVVLS